MATAPPERLTPADLVLPALVLLVLLAVLGWLRATRTAEAPPAPAEVPEAASPTDAEVPAEAAPSATCLPCHAEQVEAWEGSHHAEAQTPLGPAYAGPGAPSFTYRGQAAQVVGRIGVDPLVQWLVDVGGGRIQASQVAVHGATGDVFDVFDDGRAAGEWGHWTGGAMTWNRSCAACHATRVTKGFDGTGYRTTFAATGVGCESCHGDASAHSRTGEAPPHGGEGGDTCAPCHARRAELTDGWEVGAPFLDGFAPALLDGTEGGLFYADGQVRDEVFEWAAFASSRMHAAGVECGACHEPHSGALLREGDALCLGCHQSMSSFEPHDLHPSEGASVGCVGCHMPVTVYMQRHPRHDHGFRIPDPITGRALGLPDACSRCHPDRDNVAAFVTFYGERPVDPRARAFAEGDRDALLAIVDDIEQPAIWRASAAARAGVDGKAAARLRAHLQDADPLVRFGAWSGFGPWLLDEEDPTPWLQEGLADPVAAVRVAAARAGAPLLGPDAPGTEAYRGYLEHNADQPDALVEDASWSMARGDLARAEGRLAQALRLDPQRVSALDGMAVVASAQGRSQEAVAALEQAVGLAPDDGSLWVRLGLARAAAGDPVGAEAALLQGASRKAPRAAYNLGLLLAQQGAHREALGHLFAAEATEDGPDVRYAIASTLWSWGRRDEARVAARRVLQLDAEHGPARQLLALP